MRLQTYADLEIARQLALQGKFSMDMVAAMVHLVKQPAFVTHLVNTVAELAEFLVRGGAPQVALKVAQAASFDLASVTRSLNASRSLTAMSARVSIG